MIGPARARHRLTWASTLPPLMTLLLAALSWLTSNGWLVLLAGTSGGLFLLAVTGRAQIDDLFLSSQHGPRVRVGEELESVLQVRNGGRRRSSPVSMVLHSDGLQDVTVYVGSLRPGDSARLAMRRPALRRGLAERNTVKIVATLPVGLVRAHLLRSIPSPLTIHPEHRETGRAPLQRLRSDDSDGDAVLGHGLDLLGVREWRYGDGHRHVHWRSTARRGRLVVLDRGSTTNSALRLAMVGPINNREFETALAIAATMCDRVLRSGERISVAAWTPGGPTVAPTASPLALLDWWSALAEVVLPDPQRFAREAKAIFGRGDAFVAGPSDVLDLWYPAARDACGLLTLRRADVAP